MTTTTDSKSFYVALLPNHAPSRLAQPGYAVPGRPRQFQSSSGSRALSAQPARWTSSRPKLIVMEKWHEANFQNKRTTQNPTDVFELMLCGSATCYQLPKRLETSVIPSIQCMELIKLKARDTLDHYFPWSWEKQKHVFLEVSTFLLKWLLRIASLPKAWHNVYVYILYNTVHIYCIYIYIQECVYIHIQIEVQL